MESIGDGAVCQRAPGENHPFGLSRFPWLRKALEQGGVSILSRSTRPLPPGVWTTIR